MTTNGSATVAPISNLAVSLDFYTNVLGFTKRFEYGDFYAGVEMGPVQLHLNTKSDSPVGAGGVYIFCDEVDDYYAHITSKGANVEAPPATYPYGMRDFMARDPDGNRITFGCEVA